MSAKAWIARIAGYAGAPWTGGASIAIGEGIAQGLDRGDAIKDANAQQNAGTAAAQQRLDSQAGLNRDLYNQQRQDYQTLANTPYQALGATMGLPIASIGPSSVGAPPPPPMSREARLQQGQLGAPGTSMPPQVDAAGNPVAPMDPRQQMPVPMPAPAQTASLRSMSGYRSSGKAKGRA